MQVHMQVSFSFELRTPAYDGTQLSGYKYHSISPDKPLRVQLGQAQVPEGLETALCYMSKGEKAAFVIPAEQMHINQQQQDGSSGDSSSQQQQDVLRIPGPPAKAVQVELCVQLHDLVQVSKLQCHCRREF